MNLPKDLQVHHSITYLLIAHNLATVRHLSRQVEVTYVGLIVEQADSEDPFTTPLHPYTKALISAAVTARSGKHQERIVPSVSRLLRRLLRI
jgi:peptide/nickel transport system ATP-binding protein